MIKTKNITIIQFVVNNYKFINYNLSKCEDMNDNIVKLLKNCHRLSLNK